MIRHLAVVMDGNRRWARKNKMEVFLGHSKGGVEAVKKTIRFCLERGVEHLSLYAFSLENLKRSALEKRFLFDLLAQIASEQVVELSSKEIRVRFIGDRSLFPQETALVCEQLEEKTKNFTRLNLNVLFCYGGRQEITAAAKALVKKVKSGILLEDQISEKSFEQCFWTHGIPEPELVIRTGGAKRLSNFLLYQAAYSEFCFIDCLWPEITEKHLAGALAEFQKTKRNFGI